MNYYERHIGDYLKDTAHLSLLEHGIYARLLDVYYTRESALPAAQVARLIGARSSDEQSALAEVLAEFFIQDESGDWVQSRCDREIAHYQDKQRKASASANARWSNSGRNANALPTHSEGNAPKHQTPSTKEQDTDAIASAASAKPPRAARKCPASFDLTAELLEFAARFPAVDCRAETEKLRDHTFKNPISDWPGAWRNWIRRSSEGASAKPSASTGETAWQRSQRERMEQFAPGVAAKAPGSRKVSNIIEMEPQSVTAISMG